MDNVINIPHCTNSLESEGIADMANETVNSLQDKMKFHINNLNLYYGDFHALKGINMAIPEKDYCIYWTQRLWQINIFKVIKQNE